jgi:hypothetical protein
MFCDCLRVCSSTYRVPTWPVNSKLSLLSQCHLCSTFPSREAPLRYLRDIDMPVAQQRAKRQAEAVEQRATSVATSAGRNLEILSDRQGGGKANDNNTDAISPLASKQTKDRINRETERRTSQNPQRVSSSIGMATIMAEGATRSAKDYEHLTGASDWKTNMATLGTPARRRPTQAIAEKV